MSRSITPRSITPRSSLKVVSAAATPARPGNDLGLATDAFYAGVPVFEGFASLMDPALYRPLPGDWFVGMTDVVSSTAAIAAGRYKTVNTAGASAIAAVGNALAGRNFPFIFGGD